MAVRRTFCYVSLILTLWSFDVCGATPVLGIKCTMRSDLKWECKCNRANIILDVNNLKNHMIHCDENAELDLMERISKTKTNKEANVNTAEKVKTVKPKMDPLKIIEEEIKAGAINKEHNVDTGKKQPNPEVKVHPSVASKTGHVLHGTYNHQRKHIIHGLHVPAKIPKAEKDEVVEIPDLTKLANKPHIVHVAPPKKCHFMGKTYEDGSLTFKTRTSGCKLRCHHGNFVPGDCSEGEPQSEILISRSGSHLHINKDPNHYR